MKFIYSMLIPILGFSTVSAHATPASTDGPKMTITTSRKIGTELSYFYTVNSDDAWIDLNNNGQFDQGEKLLSDIDEATYTIQSQTLNIYGSVTTFRPSYMDLTAIDVSGNPDLEFLDCSNNNLTTLDVSKNTNLNTLWCYKNQLTSLNLTGLTKLESLNCSNNKLNSLILDNCPNLETLSLKVNELPGNVTKAIIAQIPSRTGKKGKLNAIDTQNSKDKNVFYKSDIAAAKAKNWKVTDSNNGEPIEYDGVEESATPSSQYADVNGPSVTIVVKNVGQIMSLGIKDQSTTLKPWADLNENGTFDEGEELEPNNLFQNLTLKNAILKIYGDLTILNVINYEIQSVDISKAINLTKLDLHGDNIETAIDLSKNINLEHIDLSNNSLPSINVANCTKIKKLIINNNKVTSLNLSACSALEQLKANNNELTSVELPTNAAMLKKVFIQVNKINAEEMNKIIDALPQKEARNKGTIYVIDTKSTTPADENVCTKSNAAIATDKNWDVKDWNGVNPIPYEGIEETSGAKYAPTDGSRISFHSAANVGTPLDVYVEFSDGPTPWIDLNGNGQCDGNSEILQKGVALTPKLTNADMTIYGKIKMLDLSDIAAFWNLSTIDVSHCPELEQLLLQGNQLTSIDCSANPNLQILDLSRNQLTSIDLSSNTNLSTIALDDNQIVSITLSSLPNLLNIYVQGNKLGKEEMQKIINSLPDRTGNERKGELIVLDLKKTDEGNVCTKDQVAQAKAKNWMVESKEGRTIAPYEGSEDEPADHYAPVDGPMIMLSFSEASKPIAINSSIADADANLIAWADLNGNGHFDEGEALVNGKNKITIDNKSVNLYGNFTKFEAKKANITAIDLTKATALDTLNLYKNALTDLDLSQNVNLKSLDVVSNALTALDLSHNSELTSLNCAMNKLTVLNLSQNAKLINLSAYKNELTSILLNATVNSELNKVVINSNKINASEMTKIITNLPQRTAQDGAMLIVINTKDKSEGNVCTTKDVATAKGKNWMVKDFNGSIKNMIDYEGSKDPAGIKTIAQAQVNVYPTYVHDQFTVEVPADYANGNLNLYDLSGRLLMSAQINGTKTQMSIRNLPNGIYLVKVGEVVKRIVKQ